MKKLSFLFLILSLSTLLSAQNSSEEVLIDAGKFIIINQEGKTLLYNYGSSEAVSKIILRKEIIQSVVVKDYPKVSMSPKRLKKFQEKADEGPEKNVFRVVISSKENKAFAYGFGQGAGASNVNKTYTLLFSSLSEARSFADELVLMCN